jgi:hypothetical protein
LVERAPVDTATEIDADLVFFPKGPLMNSPSFRRLLSWARGRGRSPARRIDWRPRFEELEGRTLPSASWQSLLNNAPSPDGTGTMILLSDGTVMVQGGGSNGASANWYKLTPDAHGNYVKGTWSTLASMNVARLYFASNMLPDGRVFVEGGEYTSGGQTLTNTGEIYDPVANTWTNITNFPNSSFGDDPSQVLADGTVFTGYIFSQATYIYHPSTDSWTFAANKLRSDRSDEEWFLKLADGSLLSYDVFASTGSTGKSQRYIPSSNSWVDAGSVPVALSGSAFGSELGPATLLPDGRVFWTGADNHTAIYTPSTGIWTAGPNMPTGMGADDAPLAMLPNGQVIFAADTPLFSPPTKIFDFDPGTNSLTQVATPAGLTSVLNSNPAYKTRMLVLPNGQALFTDSTDKLWVYNSGGNPQNSWRPTVSSVVNVSPGVYTLTGTQLNGLDEGASYGDDAEMSENYPIVALRSATGGLIYLCRTTNWSSTGVATGSATETVTMTLPSGVPSGTYSLYAVANGIASAPFSFTLAPAAAAFWRIGTSESTLSTGQTSSSSAAITPTRETGHGTVGSTGATLGGSHGNGLATVDHPHAPMVTHGHAVDAIFANHVLDDQL